MRTTLDLDDAIVAAARETAHRTRRSIGDVISEWARRGLVARDEPAPAGRRKKSRIPTFKVRADSPPLDLRVIKELLDNEGLPD